MPCDLHTSVSSTRNFTSDFTLAWNLKLVFRLIFIVNTQKIGSKNYSKHVSFIIKKLMPSTIF